MKSQSLPQIEKIFFELGHQSARRLLAAAELEFGAHPTDEDKLIVMAAWSAGYAAACGIESSEAHEKFARTIAMYQQFSPAKPLSS